jgi:hypothetical protein
MALEINQVAAAGGIRPPEEVVEADLKEGRGRGIGRDMAADSRRVLVGPDHHGHGVPADQALDAALDFAAAGVRRLLVGRDSVNVGRVGSKRGGHALAIGLVLELGEQKPSPIRPGRLQDPFQGIQPFPRFGYIGIPIHSPQVGRHGSSPWMFQETIRGGEGLSWHCIKRDSLDVWSLSRSLWHGLTLGRLGYVG